MQAGAFFPFNCIILRNILFHGEKSGKSILRGEHKKPLMCPVTVFVHNLSGLKIELERKMSMPLNMIIGFFRNWQSLIFDKFGSKLLGKRCFNEIFIY